MTVLIVDDSILFKERLCKDIFAISGVNGVYYAQSLAEAFDQLTKVTPDVAVVDIRMPDGNGFEVLKRMKTDTPQTVVIMLTNYPYEQYKNRARELGADYFFDKSIDTEQVIKIIEDIATGESNKTKNESKIE